MSREIKFRQFINEKMSYSGFEMCGSFVNPNVNIDIYPLMQFTGLFDKQGVEIYDGDKFLDHFENEYGAVFYCNDKACFMAKVSESTYDEYDTTSERILPLFELDLSVLEIIGNIYENKERVDEQGND